MNNDLQGMSSEELAKIAGINLSGSNAPTATTDESQNNLTEGTQPQTQEAPVTDTTKEDQGVSKIDIAKKSSDELMSIAGLTTDTPPSYDVIPGRARVEKLISQRQDMLKKALGGATEINPYDPMSMPMKGAEIAGGVFQRLESAIANPAMELQELDKPGLIKRTLDGVVKGLTGERKGEIGDVPRRAGFDDLSSAFIGLGVQGKLFDLATRNELVKNLNKVQGFIAKKFPRNGDKWILEQAKAAQDVAKGIRTAIGEGFNEIYGKVGKLSVDPTKVDEILLKSHLEDDVLLQIEELAGSHIDNIEKLKMAIDVIQTKVPSSAYLAGKLSGKGGQAAPVIQRMGTIRALKNVVDESIRPVDPDLADNLKKINDFYHTRVMPITDKLFSIVGREQIPQTTRLPSLYRSSNNAGQAASRYALNEAPKVAKEIRSYISKGSYEKEISDLVSNSSKLLRNINQARFSNDAAKMAGKVAKGAIITGAAAGLFSITKRAFAEEGKETPKEYSSLKSMVSKVENSGSEEGDWLQIEDSAIGELKRKKLIDEDITKKMMMADPKLYDEVANVYLKDLESYGIQSDRDKAIWLLMPGRFKAAEGKLENLPNVLKEAGKSPEQIKRLMNIMENRVKNLDLNTSKKKAPTQTKSGKKYRLKRI